MIDGIPQRAEIRSFDKGYHIDIAGDTMRELDHWQLSDCVCHLLLSGLARYNKDIGVNHPSPSNITTDRTNKPEAVTTYLIGQKGSTERTAHRGEHIDNAAAFGAEPAAQPSTDPLKSGWRMLP